MRVTLSAELAELITVPLAEFVAVWTAAEAKYNEAPGPYLGGVVSAFRWIAAVDETAPILGEPLRPTAANLVVEDMEAAQLVAGRGAIDARYAAGVAATLGWLRGVLTANPLDIRRAA